MFVAVCYIESLRFSISSINHNVVNFKTIKKLITCVNVVTSLITSYIAWLDIFERQNFVVFVNFVFSLKVNIIQIFGIYLKEKVARLQKFIC